MKTKKKVIRLTESDLHNMISEAVKEVLREGKVVNNKYNSCDSPFEMYSDARDFYDYGRKYYPEIWDALVKQAKKEKRYLNDIWNEIRNKRKHRLGSEYNVIEQDYVPFFNKQEERDAKLHPYEPTYMYAGDGKYEDIGIYRDYDDDTPSWSDRIKKDRR